MLLRYMPGLVAAVGGTALIALAPRRRRIAFTLIATLLGLTCMEAEYWVAHGFPADEISFFTSSVLITLAASLLGARGGMALGIAELAFFAYVNIRSGAPYLLDYILPVFYAVLVVSCRREQRWFGPSLWAPGRLEAITLWRTTTLHKWDWVLGGSW